MPFISFLFDFVSFLFILSMHFSSFPLNAYIRVHQSQCYSCFFFFFFNSCYCHCCYYSFSQVNCFLSQPIRLFYSIVFFSLIFLFDIRIGGFCFTQSHQMRNLFVFISCAPFVRVCLFGFILTSLHDIISIEIKHYHTENVFLLFL